MGDFSKTKRIVIKIGTNTLTEDTGIDAAYVRQVAAQVTELLKTGKQALVISSGAMALKSDTPFDQEGERKNPWWSDPTHRVIPRNARGEDLEFYHLHVDDSFAREDLNVLLPLELLAEM